MPELTSARFAGVQRLQDCRDGVFSARLTPNTQGEFVALVQQALIDLGHPLPNFGADGGYGDETVTAVKAYKTRHGLTSPDGHGGTVIDGIVGPGTMGKLDEECTALDEDPHECQPSPPDFAFDLAGVEEPLVNLVLAKTAAATVVGVDGEGGVRVLPASAEIPHELAQRLVEGSRDLLLDGRFAAPAELGAALTELVVAHEAAGDHGTAHAFVEGGRFLGTVLPGTALAGLLAALLGEPPPTTATTPVRDLTKPAALQEAANYELAGLITLSPSAATHPDPKVKFTIGSTVAGVTYKYTNFADRRRSNYRPAATPLAALDIRHVCGLVRLAKFLSATFGVTEIHHIGISGDSTRTDNHGNGRAVDLVGVAGTAAGTPYVLTVFNDWKNHSVPNLDKPGKRLPDWPPQTRPLEYRLDSAPTADPFAREFFRSLYAWLASEYQDQTEGPGQVVPPSTIGRGSRIMTPDHPTSSPGTKHGREAHHSHVHWQVGPTGFQAP